MTEICVSTSENVRHYAFVVPRYGRSIGGGAETLVRELACRLAARGDAIQVWTTCARDNRSWENELPAGTGTEDGVTVTRFPVDARDLDTWIPLQLRIHEGLQLTLSEQLDWMQESVNSSQLYEHILMAADTVEAVFFAPYLFGTTFWGSLLRPDKAVLIPCLHNETYAYTTVIQSMFRQARGCLFNALPEQDLASALYGSSRGGEVGMGFDVPDSSTLDALTPYFDDAKCYILYVGRKETGKNVQVLVDNFIQAKSAGTLPEDLALVIAGGGSFSDIGRPDALERSDIIDIGYLDERDKQRLIKFAICLCQPSTNESFSIVLMESWMLGTPVVVHGNCAVTRHHAVASGGGLYFTSEPEFAAVLERLITDPKLRLALSNAGAAYVQERYSWPAVLDRFDAVMESLEAA